MPSHIIPTKIFCCRTFKYLKQIFDYIFFCVFIEVPSVLIGGGDKNVHMMVKVRAHVHKYFGVCVCVFSILEESMNGLVFVFQSNNTSTNDSVL